MMPGRNSRLLHDRETATCYNSAVVTQYCDGVRNPYRRITYGLYGSRTSRGLKDQTFHGPTP